MSKRECDNPTRILTVTMTPSIYRHPQGLAIDDERGEAKTAAIASLLGDASPVIPNFSKRRSYTLPGQRDCGGQGRVRFDRVRLVRITVCGECQVNEAGG